MIKTDDKHLLMIEPKGCRTEPIEDRLTDLARTVYGMTRKSSIRYKGWHMCVCGEWSDNVDHILPDGVVTNSLMIHYIECHREEVPESEIEKLTKYGNRNE